MNVKESIRQQIGEDKWNRFTQLKYIKNNYYVRNLLWVGEKRAEEFNFSQFKKLVLDYVESMKVNDFEYRFSNSVFEPTLYASVYACMIKGFFNDILPDEKLSWKQYFDKFQRDDGLFQDNTFYNEKYNEGDGWGARHLQGHIIIAYERLGFTPLKEFSFLNHFINLDNIISWLNSLDFKQVWKSSNSIMNYGVCLQYARDYMGMNTDKSITTMREWLLQHLRKDCGMWYDGSLNSDASYYEAIRGAYHIYPLFIYDGIKIPYANEALEIILKMQNKWGGFDYKICSSACADIDAIDPMIRLALQTNRDKDAIVHEHVQKALKWVLVNQRSDGGFVFDYSKEFCYGGARSLYSKLHESNMFATWFRVLSILYMQEFLGNCKNDFVKVPGYEYPLK